MGNQKRKAESARQKQRRRALAIGVVTLVAIGAGVVYLLFSNPTPLAEPSPNAAGTFAGGPATLLYVDFSTSGDLHEMDLTTEADETTGVLSPQGDTHGAPGSQWLSVQTREEPEPGTFRPGLYVFDTQTQTETLLGVGFDPKWSPTGARVAWSKPADESKCGEEACRGDVSIVVTDPVTGKTTDWTEPGSYTLVGWSGDYLIVQEDPPDGPPALHSISETGEIQQLPLRPIDYWGASPDGEWIVQSGDIYNRFLRMEEGNIAGEGEEIGIRAGTRLGRGAWAHDSTRVAAFAVGEGAELDFVTFSPADPDPVVLTDGGSSSTGTVLWTPDNDGIVFQRFNGEELEAVYCPLDGDCKVALSWTSGISLLRVE